MVFEAPGRPLRPADLPRPEPADGQVLLRVLCAQLEPAQTPNCGLDPCGSAPDRYATAIGTSSGASDPRLAASRSTFARREEVAATSIEVLAITANGARSFMSVSSPEGTT